MPIMERIVRPHVVVDPTPTKITPKCRDPLQNTVVKFQAPPGLTTYGANLGGGGGVKIQDPPKSNITQKSKSSSFAYAYKKYMTKQEKEITDSSDSADGVVEEKK